LFPHTAGVDFGIAIYNRYSGDGANVGYAAHLGGALAGLCGDDISFIASTKLFLNLCYIQDIFTFCLLR